MLIALLKRDPAQGGQAGRERGWLDGAGGRGGDKEEKMQAAERDGKVKDGDHVEIKMSARAGAGAHMHTCTRTTSSTA